MATSSEYNLQRIVALEINQRVNEIIHEEAANAAERVTQRIRENCAQLCMSVMSHFTFHQMQNEIVIKVDTRALDDRKHKEAGK